MALLRRQDPQAGDDYADAYAQLQGNVGDVLRQIRASRIAGSEQLVSDRFGRTVGHLADLETRYFRASHRSLVVPQVLAAAVVAGLIFVALELWQMPLAIVLPVVVVFARIAPLAGTVQQGLRIWRYNAPALARLRA